MQKRIITAYEETYKALGELYKKRKRTLFFQKVMWGITGIYFVFMLMLLGLNYYPGLENGPLAFLKQFQLGAGTAYGNVYPIVGLILLLYPTTFLFARAFQKFKTTENETMAKMVRTLFPEVEFTLGAIAPTQEVAKSKLFAWITKESPVYNYGQIRSRTNETVVNIADIGITEKNITNTFLTALMQIPILNMFVVMYQNVFKNMATSKLADNTNFTYRGLFCWLSFKKHLKGHTIVLPKSQMTKLDRLASFNFKEEQKIHLEDPRFTNKFVVYSTDQIEARYVLSATIMEKIVALREKFNRPILMSFLNRQMYLAVKNENGLFSFPSGKLDTIEVIEELANEIETALEVVADMVMV